MTLFGIMNVNLVGTFPVLQASHALHGQKQLWPYCQYFTPFPPSAAAVCTAALTTALRRLAS